jgi:hypothetical protein
MRCGGRGAISNAAAGSCAEMCAYQLVLIPPPLRLELHTGDPAMRHFSPTLFGAAAREPALLPNRPDAGVLNRVIPLFFIGRNKNGFWLAREAGGWIGGMFLLRRSAVRFAQEASAPHGCATMLLVKTFELDTWNSGNPLVGWLNATLGLLSRFVPDYPPPIPIAEKYRKRNWL